jgi:hypothetical protein
MDNAYNVHQTLQLVPIQLQDYYVEMDSIYKEEIVLLAHHQLQDVLDQIPSKHVLMDSMLFLNKDKMFHVALAQPIIL